jgi:hypothetical protein
VVHRCSVPEFDRTHHHNIPVTTPTRTLIDMATILTRPQLEAAINEADKLDLVDPSSLRASLEERAGQRGAAALRAILDRHTFVLTRSELERRFLPIARQAGLPKPETQALVNGFEVDFYWPALGLVIETDGLRYHRTPAEQAKDRLRDQAHRRGPHVAPLHPRSGPLRAGACAASPRRRRVQAPRRRVSGMSTNGKRRPPRPRIELVSAGASESEAAAIVAAVEQFLADTAPPPEHRPPANPWQRAALEEGISARQVSGRAWGHSPPRSARGSVSG